MVMSPSSIREEEGSIRDTSLTPLHIHTHPLIKLSNKESKRERKAKKDND